MPKPSPPGLADDFRMVPYVIFPKESLTPGFVAGVERRFEAPILAGSRIAVHALTLFCSCNNLMLSDFHFGALRRQLGPASGMVERRRKRGRGSPDQAFMQELIDNLTYRVVRGVRLLQLKIGNLHSILNRCKTQHDRNEVLASFERGLGRFGAIVTRNRGDFLRTMQGKVLGFDAALETAEHFLVGTDAEAGFKTLADRYYRRRPIAEASPELLWDFVLQPPTIHEFGLQRIFLRDEAAMQGRDIPRACIYLGAIGPRFMAFPYLEPMEFFWNRSIAA